MQQRQVIFEQFFNNQSVEIPTSPILQHNLFILEMYNNWPFVRVLMLKHRENKLKEVDEMEHNWLNFILNNQIEIETFKDKEEFLELQLKSLT